MTAWLFLGNVWTPNMTPSFSSKTCSGRDIRKNDVQASRDNSPARLLRMPRMKRVCYTLTINYNYEHLDELISPKFVYKTKVKEKYLHKKK